MNNKGFAIMTILYGLLILFCLLLVSLLGILSTLKNNLQILIEAGNGSRNIVTITKKTTTSYDTVSERGLYCISTTDCKYVPSK